MTTIATDAFTETSNTALADHTPTSGGTAWQVEAAQFTINGTTDDLHHNSATTQRAVMTGAPIGDDIMVISARVKVANTAAKLAGLTARCTSGDFVNQYEAYILRNTNTEKDVLLFKNVGGVRTQLGSTATITLGSGVYCSLKLEIGTGTQKVYTDVGAGYVLQISTTESDATLAGGQLYGVIMNGSAGATTAVDDLLAETFAEAAGQPAVKRMGAVPGGRQIAPAGGGRVW